MERFVYQGTPSRVVFEWDALAKLPDELSALGARRALILCTPEQRPLAERVGALLGERAAGVCAQAVMHVPVEVARAARDAAAAADADCCVAIGGGSTIGLGKAIALESSLPILAVPTTYAGSEMTPIYGLTEGRLKRTGRDARVLPRTVLYDPSLTLSLPAGISAASGINAMAHAVEALYAVDANPVISLMAEESIRALGDALPAVVRAPEDRDARSRALYGAWLAGTCLGAVGMALHHKLCHTLGGTFNLPHAQTHAAMLPHTAHYNHAAAPDALRRVARALGGDAAADAGPLLFRLNERLGIAPALADLGMPEDGLDEAADLACSNPYANPRPIERAAIRELLQRAWEGRAPR
ncbi:maleylacetate reductase [Burkholderia pseudomultivorans]|uniref:Maleylacetate reductase n=1 Tax=Burkholderia pseudomultivorans TaxID=1207504 RepID=A0ABU2ED94_9BURK|nr:maleylacetate reductase [Burkholderia pseudomultivorans]MDR8731408.1 Maleylacetate reductase [Burkholderia pseudomultivorans]MDR8738992.1 Maleylacetate reductase [Burkholderia pseudomultivorans]MDR8745543.1 Maleylacetate reductase [Burkholderia pseudomultivorans]MDR8757865.1 Maleylacetate reductase [Burkholderia pseudomultivorans]MDR8781931.1 Maleylacetate reductase [Burkholderia pseudomultivorans]